jgi:hypothetical protein
MDADKKQPIADATAASSQASPPGADATPPSDALGKPSDDTQDSGGMPDMGAGGADGKPPKKLSPLKKLLKRVNIYLILFVVVGVISVAIAFVTYLGSKKTPVQPAAESQNLTEAQLKELANSNATVGGSGETLTVQGNAVFSGSVLVRSNLNVVGTIQMGGPLTLSQLNVTSSANLASTQINSLQVSGTSTFQNLVTLQAGLSAGGNSSFTGTVTAGTLTVSNLVMSNNSLLTVPNHVSFTGATPRVTSGSATISGSDTSGTITINSGASAGACMATIAFNQPFQTTPHVLVSPLDAGAGGIEFYVIRSTTSFQICTAAGASSGQQFGFSYFITD